MWSLWSAWFLFCPAHCECAKLTVAYLMIVQRLHSPIPSSFSVPAYTPPSVFPPFLQSLHSPQLPRLAPPWPTLPSPPTCLLSPPSPPRWSTWQSGRTCPNLWALPASPSHPYRPPPKHKPRPCLNSPTVCRRRRPRTRYTFSSISSCTFTRRASHGEVNTWPVR